MLYALPLIILMMVLILGPFVIAKDCIALVREVQG